MVTMDFDSALKIIGGFGPYQRLVFFTACLSNLPAVFHNMAVVFIGAAPDHWCASPELERLNLSVSARKNLTIPLEQRSGETVYSRCRMYDVNYTTWSPDDEDIQYIRDSQHNVSTVPCRSGWTYDDSVYTSTIVTQWDLVCESEWLQATSASVYMGGLMFGVLIFGSIADCLGRKRALTIALPLLIVLGVATAFAPTFPIFIALRFCTGMCAIGFYTTGFVVAMELVGPTFRVHAGIGYQYFWALLYMLLAGLAYFFRDWFTLQLLLSAPLVLLLATLLIIPESPRWLYSHDRRKEADTIVRRIAKSNKCKAVDDIDIEVKHEKKGTLLDLVRTPKLRMRTLNLWFNWYVNSLAYYGLSLSTGDLGGNQFFNFFISGAVEIPAFIVCQVTLTYLGRRGPLGLNMIFGGLFMMLILLVPKDLTGVIIALAMLGKFCITSSFGIIYVFTAELYPTTVRSVGVGAGSCWARLGGVSAPFIGYLGRRYHSYIPPLTLGLLVILGGFLTFIMPETKDQKLPDTIEEGEEFGRKPKKAEKEKELSGVTSDALLDKVYMNGSSCPEKENCHV